MTEITAALITAVFAFMGTALTVFYGRRKTDKSIAKSAEVTAYRLDRLEQKVDGLCEGAVCPFARRERKPFAARRYAAARA